MSIVLRGLITRICLAYFNDVIVNSRLDYQHVLDLRTVVERLRVADIKPSLLNASLFYRQSTVPRVRRQWRRRLARSR